MPTYNGKTVEEAVAKAKAALKVPEEQLAITVEQEPRHGFLGIGRRLAIVKVTVKQAVKKQPFNNQAPRHQATPSAHKIEQAPKVQPTPQPSNGQEEDPAVIKARHEANLKRAQMAGAQLTKYLQVVLQKLGVQTNPVIKAMTVHEITIDIRTKQPGRVIGHHGRQINALEQLSAAFMNYHGAPKTAVILDTSDYRQRRQKALHELAERSVTEVVASGQAVFLDPMPARERKQLHKELEGNAHVRTYSHGREPYRSVVIAPRN